MTTTKHPRIQAVTEDARVTPIELFFDLVFVFSLTQVTALMSHDLTGQGVVRGMLVLCLLWWCWVGFAWIGNVLRADEGVGRVAMFGSMGAMFVLALCVPEAFVDLPGGLFGPVVARDHLPRAATVPSGDLLAGRSRTIPASAVSSSGSSRRCS